MVMQRWHLDWQQLRLEHSTGWALAVAINLLLLMLMTLPTPALDGLRPPPPVPVTHPWIELQPQAPTPPAPPPPVAPPRPQPVLNEVLRTSAPAVAQSVLAAQPEPFELPVPASQPAQAAPAPSASAAASPDSEASIDYDFAPLPDYPRPAMQRGLQGTVLLRIAVDHQGRVQQVEIEQSSGHAQLDRAALLQVSRHWRFRPALRGGQPVAGWVRVPIEFSLRR